MKHILLIAFLFGTIGLGLHFYGETLKERVDIGPVTDTPLLLGKDSVIVEDQESEGKVIIKILTLSRNGFVVLQDDEQGPGKVIGTSELLSSGRKRNFVVTLDEEVPTGYVFVSLYQDDGDGTFNIETDIPIRGVTLARVQARVLLTTKMVKSELAPDDVDVTVPDLQE